MTDSLTEERREGSCSQSREVTDLEFLVRSQKPDSNEIEPAEGLPIF